MSHPCSEGLLSRPSDCRVWAAGLKPVSEARLTLRCLAVPLEGPEWLDTLPFPLPAAASAKHSLDKSFASLCRLLRKQKWWTGLDFRLLWTVRDVFLVCVAMWWRATFSCVLLRVESRDLVRCQQFCFSLPSLSSSEARNGGGRGIERERGEEGEIKKRALVSFLSNVSRVGKQEIDSSFTSAMFIPDVHNTVA